MFDLSWSHILILLIVALVVVGPKDLPKMMRTAGRWMAKARAMADQFRKSFDEMARQSELDELRTEIQALRSQRPLADIEQTMNRSILPPDPPITPPQSVVESNPEAIAPFNADSAAVSEVHAPEPPHP
jgi:sec-independent protein translocase protein TatB